MFLTATVRAGTPTVAAAIAKAARRDEVTAAQVVQIEDNLKDAPLTAQVVAQRRVKLTQVLDPAEVASYEKVLNDRRHGASRLTTTGARLMNDGG
jgi:hypothetical protein